MRSLKLHVPNFQGRIRGYGVKRHFQQLFSYIMAVSFNGGGNQSTPRKPTTCRKSLTNLWYGVHLAMSGIRTRNSSGDRYGIPEDPVTGKMYF